MNLSRFYKISAAPILAMGLTMPATLMVGCDDDLGLDCEADIVAKVEAFNGAVDALIRVSGEMKASVAVACANMATDLGSTDAPDVGDGSNVSDDDVTAACNAASAALDVAVSASGGVSLQIIGGKCEVNASAQLNCEASCSVDGSCDPGGVEARCEPGELSVSCSGECSGECTVESGSVTCEGSCSGTCEGDCSGTCAATGTSGACSGSCEGTCEGECTGTCEIVPATAECSGSCKGGCEGTATAPSCEAELTPPSCDIDAECSGGCEAEGNISAECTPPQIIVEVEGNADLKATLEANLPDIFLVFEVQGALVVDSAVYVAETAIGVAAAALEVPACLAQFGAELTGKFTGAVEASASVNVSVSASASASGSAGG
ncbi:MAG: hypothetical protein JRI68_22020 [Deltaproteobacteria bacterium]|nr:hypothetical protein [Deltaproteobacteria bacterium]